MATVHRAELKFKDVLIELVCMPKKQTPKTKRVIELLMKTYGFGRKLNLFMFFFVV